MPAFYYSRALWPCSQWWNVQVGCWQGCWACNKICGKVSNISKVLSKIWKVYYYTNSQMLIKYTRKMVLLPSTASSLLVEASLDIKHLIWVSSWLQSRREHAYWEIAQHSQKEHWVCPLQLEPSAEPNNVNNTLGHPQFFLGSIEQGHAPENQEEMIMVTGKY